MIRILQFQCQCFIPCFILCFIHPFFHTCFIPCSPLHSRFVPEYCFVLPCSAFFAEPLPGFMLDLPRFGILRLGLLCFILILFLHCCALAWSAVFVFWTAYLCVALIFVLLYFCCYSFCFALFLTGFAFALLYYISTPSRSRAPMVTKPGAELEPPGGWGRGALPWHIFIPGLLFLHCFCIASLWLTLLCILR